MMKKALSLSLLVVLLSVGLNLKVTTRYGINYNQFEKKIPLYLKSLRFVTRHIEMSRLADEIIQGKLTDQQKIEATFQWVIQNIKRQPKELQTVDDHPYSIIVRGYAVSDQFDDIFSLLMMYMGFKSFYDTQKSTLTGGRYPLVFVLWNENWIAFDVYRRTYFMNPDQGSNRWASLDQLKKGDFDLVTFGDEKNPLGKDFYIDLFRKFDLSSKNLNQYLKRNLAQFPLKRLWWELAHPYI